MVVYGQFHRDGGYIYSNPAMNKRVYMFEYLYFKKLFTCFGYQSIGCNCLLKKSVNSSYHCYYIEADVIVTEVTPKRHAIAGDTRS